MRLLIVIGIVLSTFLTFQGIIFFLAGHKIGHLFAAILFGLLDIWCIKKNTDIKSGAVAYWKMLKKEAEAMARQSGRERKEQLERMMLAKHHTGLPLAYNAQCFVTKEKDCFQVSGGGNEFILKNEKITDICVNKDVHKQKQYVSSSAGAVGGAILFGPIGAMIGGRKKKIESESKTCYLIISYISEEEISSISFEIPAGGLNQAYKWESEFKHEANDRRRNVVEI